MEWGHVEVDLTRIRQAACKLTKDAYASERTGANNKQEGVGVLTVHASRSKLYE